MSDPLHTPHLDGWPTDPMVTYDPGRTVVVRGTDVAGPVAGVTDQPELATWAVVPACGELPALPGRSVYHLQRILGTGGFGEVWEAVQVSLGRVVALKRPLRGGTAASEATP